jgi:hypothetical protein
MAIAKQNPSDRDPVSCYLCRARKTSCKWASNSNGGVMKRVWMPPASIVRMLKNKKARPLICAKRTHEVLPPADIPGRRICETTRLLGELRVHRTDPLGIRIDIRAAIMKADANLQLGMFSEEV